MKVFLILIILIANSTLALAQITLEKKYSYSTTVCEFSGDDQYYYLMDVPQSQCRIYSTDHTLYKTINLPVPEGCYLSDIQLVSKHVFNTDNSIELLYIYEKYFNITSAYYVEYGLNIINEDGTNLLSLPDGGWAELKQVNGENKLLAYTYIYNELGYYEVSTNVYKLGGSGTKVSLVKPTGISVYPNPANSHLTISTEDNFEMIGGEFTLYTVGGKKVISYPITNKQQTIPIKNLPTGPYVYSISNKNNFKYSNIIIVR